MILSLARVLDIRVMISDIVKIFQQNPTYKISGRNYMSHFFLFSMMKIIIILLLSINALGTDALYQDTLISRKIMMYDSGVFQAHDYVHVTSPILWLDNDTIVFRGTIGGKIKAVEHLAQWTNHRDPWVIWHLGSTPIPLSDARWPNQDTLEYRIEFGHLVALDHTLYRDGVLWKSTHYKKVAEGLPGKMNDVLPDQCSEQYENMYNIHVGHCDYENFLYEKNRLVLSDSSRENYITMNNRVSSPENPRTIRFIHRNSPDEFIEINISPQDMAVACARYYAFSESFYILDCAGESMFWNSDHSCYPYWDISIKSRDIERKCINYEPSLGPATVTVLFTKLGVLFSGDPVDNHPGKAGMYLSIGTKNERLITGLINGPTVSPNGCRIAFSYAKSPFALNVMKSEKSSVIAIDLCKSQEQ